MSLKVCFQLWFISKHHPSPFPLPLCQLWTWPGWPRYLSPPGWILPWFTVSKTGHETDGQILAGSHRNCFMLWDMSSNVQGPLLGMGQLPNTARLSPWSISSTGAMSPRNRAAPKSEDEACDIGKKVQSVTSVGMRYLHCWFWVFYLPIAAGA